jgi:antitoxin component of RelBE/YafQ-DinJ toxin-antitoxin module
MEISSTLQNGGQAQGRTTDAMVTARMGAAKKAEAIAVLEASGLNASSAINALFDYVIKYGSMPNLCSDLEGVDSSLNQRIAEASEWFNRIDLAGDLAVCDGEGA